MTIEEIKTKVREFEAEEQRLIIEVAELRGIERAKLEQRIAKTEDDHRKAVQRAVALRTLLNSGLPVAEIKKSAKLFTDD